MGKVDKEQRHIRNDPPGESSFKSSDRRLRGNRLNISFQVIASYQGKIIQGYVEAINISWSGMLLATNFPINLYDELRLEFTLPGSDAAICTYAKVVHRINGNFPEEPTRVGVVFTEVDPNTRRMLSGYVLERLQAI